MAAPMDMTESLAQPAARSVIPVVVSQHVEDSAALRHMRSTLVRAPHVKLHQLRRLDDRIAAQLDGLVVAGPYGRELAVAMLESPGTGETFAATVLTILAGDAGALDMLYALAAAHPPAAAGLVSAFGWVSAPGLRGVVAALLSSADAFRRQVGLATCAMHRVDPGATLDAALIDPDAGLRARALRVAGELARGNVLPACLASLAGGDDVRCRFEAARSAVLLGERDAASASLHEIALSADPCQLDALRLLLKLTPPAQSRMVLKTLADDPTRIRLLIQGVGTAGDAHYVPWLIKQMADAKLARLAGESFSMITGLDLADLDLEVGPPEGVELGPSDDPADDSVAMDEDEGLPWPDAAKVDAWWRAHGSRLPSGTRWFMGEIPSPLHCSSVLKSGFQRQRIAAAQYLSLLQPGTSLFPTAAPAWRQQRWLDQMS